MTSNHPTEEVATEGGKTTDDEDDDQRSKEHHEELRPEVLPKVQITLKKKEKSLEVSSSTTGAPDGGWGWVVVFASFMISLVADGISFSFGIIFLELSTYFNESKSKTAFVGSLFMSIPLLIGPLASALTEKYGCRKITIVSGLISCIGFIIGTFATSIEHLFIAFSVAGAGLALSYVTSIVIVAYYFEKKRSLATGLAVCGTGFGTFIFAPLTIYLMEEYGWRGTLLIMSGFFLNIVVFGALMRDLPDEDDDEDDDEDEDDEEDNESDDSDDHSQESLHRQSVVKIDGGSKRGNSFMSNHKFLQSSSSRDNNDALSLGSLFPISFSTSNDATNKPSNKSGNNIFTYFFSRQTSHQPSCSTPFKDDQLNHPNLPSTLNDARIPPTMSPSASNKGCIRQSSSLINIPTFLTNTSASTLDDNQVSIINELSVKKGGVLSRLIQRYPNMLSTLFSSPTHNAMNNTNLNTAYQSSQASGKEGRVSRPPLTSRTESEVTPDLTPSDVYEMQIGDEAVTSRSSFWSSPPNNNNNQTETINIGSNSIVSNGHVANYTTPCVPVLPIVVQGLQSQTSSLQYNNQASNGSSNNNHPVVMTSPPNHVMIAPRVSIRSPQSSNNTFSFKSPTKKYHNEPRTIINKRLSVNPMIVTGYRLNSLIPFEHGTAMSPNHTVGQSRSKLQRGSITYRSAVLNIHRRMHSNSHHRVRSSSCPDMTSVVVSSKSVLLSREKSRKQRAKSSWKESVKDFLIDLIDISIFKSLKYSLFCFSNLLLYACIDVPYVYIPDHAITSGSSSKEEASFLISLIGMVNTLGIVFVGYIGDKPWLDPTHLYSALICCSGISVFLIPLLSSYTCLAILSSMYGLTISANYALVSVILVDLISLDKFTIGYGLLLMVQGIASLIGPPFAGWLCDLTGTYDVTFYVTGLCIFVSGAVVLPVANKGVLKKSCCQSVKRRPKTKMDKALVIPEVDVKNQTDCDVQRKSISSQDGDQISNQTNHHHVQVRKAGENDDEYEIVL